MIWTEFVYALQRDFSIDAARHGKYWVALSIIKSFFSILRASLCLSIITLLQGDWEAVSTVIPETSAISANLMLGNSSRLSLKNFFKRCRFIFNIASYFIHNISIFTFPVWAVLYPAVDAVKYGTFTWIPMPIQRVFTQFYLGHSCVTLFMSSPVWVM